MALFCGFVAKQDFVFNVNSIKKYFFQQVNTIQSKVYYVHLYFDEIIKQQLHLYQKIPTHKCFNLLLLQVGLPSFAWDFYCQLCLSVSLHLSLFIFLSVSLYSSLFIVLSL